MYEQSHAFDFDSSTLHDGMQHLVYLFHHWHIFDQCLQKHVQWFVDPLMGLSPVILATHVQCNWIIFSTSFVHTDSLLDLEFFC